MNSKNNVHPNAHLYVCEMSAAQIKTAKIKRKTRVMALKVTKISDVLTIFTKKSQKRNEKK